MSPTEHKNQPSTDSYSAITPAPPLRPLKVLLAGVCALILSVGLSRFAYTPMLPLMHNEAGLSDLEGGWLATFNYGGYMAGALLAASISSLRTKFIFYRVGLIVALFSTLGMGLTHDFAVWAALRMLGGFSSTAGMLLASGLILNWLLRHQHKPELGLHFAGVGLGVAVSGLAAAAMAQRLAWDQQWQALGWLGCVFAVPAWLWLPAPAAGPMPAAPNASAPAASSRWMLLLMATYFCAGFGYVVSATFIVTILEKLPLLQGHGGWVWVLVGLTATPSSMVWDRAAQRLGQLPALMLAYGLQIVSIVLPALSQDAALNVLSAVLYGGTFVGIVSLTLSLIGRRFPLNPAKAMARLTLSYGVAQIAAPAISGAIAHATGSYRNALLMAAIVMLAGLLLLHLLRLEESAK